MAVNRQIEQSLARLTLEQRERHFHHHSYREDLRQYELMRRGDPGAVAEGERMFRGPNTGSLSDDPLTNYRYLFVSAVTMACRFCMEGGMDSEIAYNLSDLYIRRMDRCESVEEIFSLHSAMFSDFTSRMGALIREKTYSLPVHKVMEYISRRLQDPLTVEHLAKVAGLTPSYLSTLFKKETGIALSEYIRRERIDMAGQLLQYTDYSCTDIAEYLCFSSDSHFSRVFREYVGLTPTEYRKRNFQRFWNKDETPERSGSQ